MKYEDLKCEFCNGNGDTEKYVEPYGDSPITCTFCNGTGIDQEQLKVVKVERSEEVKKEPEYTDVGIRSSYRLLLTEIWFQIKNGRKEINHILLDDIENLLNNTKGWVYRTGNFEKWEDSQSEIESLKKKHQTDSKKLELLAKWHDLNDIKTGDKNNEVQSDLRRIAEYLRKGSCKK